MKPPTDDSNWSDRVSETQTGNGVDYPVAGIIIENQAGETFRARIVAAPQVAAGALSALPQTLEKEGFKQSYIDVVDGKHQLVLSGLSAAQTKKLAATLQGHGAMAADSVNENVKSETDIIKQRLKRDSLKWSGRFAMAGSAAVAIAGAGQKDYKRVQTGLTLMAADSVVAIYGNGRGAIDFNKLFDDMHTHFTHNGVLLPNIATPEKRQNAIGQVNQFIAEHPIELNYGLGMLSGIGHMRSGLADYQRSGAGISRMTKGVLGAAGSAGVIFLPEDKDRKKEAKSVGHYLTHPLEIPKGMGDFVLASPIRFKGLLSGAYSLLYLTDTLEERKKMKLWANNKGGLYNGKSHHELSSELGQLLHSSAMHSKSESAINQAKDLRKGMAELERREGIAKTTFGGKVSPYLSAFTAIAYLTASLLAAASSRNRDDSFESASEYEPMYAMAARTVSMLPKEERDVALAQVATYLSSQKDVKDGAIKAPDIIAEVTQRLEHIDQSPWLMENHKTMTHSRA